MGGYGSGNWYRWRARPVIEDGLTLDLPRMLRTGSLVPGVHLRGRLHWTRRSDGSEVASLGYEADLRHADDAWMQLHYRHNDEPRDYRIWLETTRPNFGGIRWWFTCPLTARRVSMLHLPSGAPKFGCRQAYGLAYRSQNEDRSDRLASRAHKLRERIGGEPGFSQPMPPKPKGMHWKTFHRIREEIWDLEEASLLAMAQKIPGFKF